MLDSVDFTASPDVEPFKVRTVITELVKPVPKLELTSLLEIIADGPSFALIVAGVVSVAAPSRTVMGVTDICPLNIVPDVGASGIVVVLGEDPIDSIKRIDGIVFWVCPVVS